MRERDSRDTTDTQQRHERHTQRGIHDRDTSRTRQRHLFMPALRRIRASGFSCPTLSHKHTETAAHTNPPPPRAHTHTYTHTHTMPTLPPSANSDRLPQTPPRTLPHSSSMEKRATKKTHREEGEERERPGGGRGDEGKQGRGGGRRGETSRLSRRLKSRPTFLNAPPPTPACAANHDTDIWQRDKIYGI